MKADTLKKLIRTKDVRTMCLFFFGQRLTPTQETIVRTIAFAEHKRVVLCCLTRYGKSYCVAMGVLLYILLHRTKRILLIAPLIKQTRIIRNYIADRITTSKIFQLMIDIHSTGIDRIKNEISKERIVFKNGCELLILSAEGDADRLMGFGGDLVIQDEACLIAHEVYRAKISRMLGDSPDSVSIEIGNPWHRDNHMYEHWIDPDYLHIHVGEDTALEEGRTTQAFLDEQKKTLTPLEYQILYRAEFPEESDDSIFILKNVRAATSRTITAKPVEFIVSCDPADKGMDWTVIYWGVKYDSGHYQVQGYYSEPKSENMQIANRMFSYRQHNTGNLPTLFKVDTGMGVGIISRLKEQVAENCPGKAKVVGCNFGEGVGVPGMEHPSQGDHISDRKPTSSRKRFRNRKAEQYFRLKELFDDGMMLMPDLGILIKELMSMKWEFTEGGKIKIVDPDKSPDYADALVIFTWQAKSNFVLVFTGEGGGKPAF